MSSHTQTLEQGKVSHAEMATRFGGTILEAWGDMVFLVREPNRFGQPVHRIRLILADLPPHRYGDYEEEAYARDLFDKTVAFVEDRLTDIFFDGQDLGDGCNELGGLSVER